MPYGRPNSKLQASRSVHLWGYDSVLSRCLLGPSSTQLSALDLMRHASGSMDPGENPPRQHDWSPQCDDRHRAGSLSPPPLFVVLRGNSVASGSWQPNRDTFPVHPYPPSYPPFPFPFRRGSRTLHGLHPVAVCVQAAGPRAVGGSTQPGSSHWASPQLWSPTTPPRPTRVQTSTNTVLFVGMVSVNRPVVSDTHWTEAPATLSQCATWLSRSGVSRPPEHGLDLSARHGWGQVPQPMMQATGRPQAGHRARLCRRRRARQSAMDVGRRRSALVVSAPASDVARMSVPRRARVGMASFSYVMLWIVFSLRCIARWVERGPSEIPHYLLSQSYASRSAILWSKRWRFMFFFFF
ncbi:hypothetical protein EV126DRAFT_119110 [Verticillium dahliae]|nr:hypothetical protein EV126DRAFT_119110 [Verticillium dahliae]